VLLALAGTGAAEENKPLDPAVVLGLVQSFYDQTKTLQAEFEQTRYTQLYDRYDRATGKVVFKKPGMMRWDYAQPNGQVFVSNGKKLLIYQPPEEGEKRGQLIERAVDEDQLPSAFSFLTGSGNLEKDFEVRLLEHDNEKFEDGYVLQLIPRRPTPNYEQLVFYVRSSDHRLGRQPQPVRFLEAQVQPRRARQALQLPPAEGDREGHALSACSIAQRVRSR
jgi:outer membrane lipoprotein carrier protein